MNLLADFRNYQYMLPQINGITIHMEDKVTRINFPRNRYDEVFTFTHYLLCCNKSNSNYGYSKSSFREVTNLQGKAITLRHYHTYGGQSDMDQFP